MIVLKHLLILALMLAGTAVAQESSEVLPVVEAGFPVVAPTGVENFEVLERTQDTLTVKHLYGETTIPRQPKRIVTDMNTAEILISLGLLPVGYLSPEGQGISPIIAEIAPEMTLLSVTETPNYEQILALEPDLIIGASWLGTDGEANDYELMSEIAPTLPFRLFPSLMWDASTRQVATLFGLEARAEEIITDYHARVATAKDRIAPVFEDETASPLLFFGPSAWLYSPYQETEGQLYSEDSIGWLYYELGLTPGNDMVRFFTEQPGPFIPWLEVTGEQLPDIDAENLIVFPNGYSGAEGISEGYTAYTKSAIWQKLPAVQAQKVHVITGVNKGRGYYTRLENIEIFADLVTTSSSEAHE